MSESNSRSTIIETMARATRADLYEEAEAPENANPTMQAYYKVIIDKHERLMDYALAAYEAHLEASGMAVVGWRPIESAPKGRTVIVAYRNRLGNWRQVMARYYGPEALDSDETEDGFAPEGWYEESDTQENLLRTDEPPEFWQPLLPSPTDGAAVGPAKVRHPLPPRSE